MTAAWTRSEGKRSSGGLNQKGVESYRRENPGSKLKTAVTRDPSKLKKGGKAAGRRKSFCARMSGMKRRNTSSKTANDPNSRINKSLRKWNCSAIDELMEFGITSTARKLKHLKNKHDKSGGDMAKMWKGFAKNNPRSMDKIEKINAKRKVLKSKLKSQTDRRSKRVSSANEVDGRSATNRRILHDERRGLKKNWSRSVHNPRNRTSRDYWRMMNDL